MKRTILFLLILIITLPVFAQEQTVQMADTMRSNGKIYVVVATISVIFLGLIIYLFSIDRRISKLEKGKK